MKRDGQGPIRTCMGCGQRDAQAEMLRIANTDEGNLQVAPRAPRSGRSGYLHRSQECWRRFMARKGLIRSLGRQVDRETRKVLVESLNPDRTSCP